MSYQKGMYLGEKIKAAFLDRDGTIIEEVNFLHSLEQIKLIPRMVRVCQVLQEKGYTLFVVTNQSGVARGYFTLDFVHEAHRVLGQLLAEQGVFIKDWYVCPHHPTEGAVPGLVMDCACRKPKPGLLHQAAAQYDILLNKSIMIGDADRDIEAGRAAGCRSYYVSTLTGMTDEELYKEL